MTLCQQVRFALRQLGREWKTGELSILLLALVIAIASHTAIGHFTTRISGAMVANANDIIGGDLALVGGRPAPPSMLAPAEAGGLRIARTVQFSSVISANDEILLVGVKAVDDGYPLKGSLKIADELYGPTRSIKSGPAAGEAWVEARVMRTLKLEPGDYIELGKARLAAVRILAFEPDRGRNFYSFTPRVLISARDLEKTGILQPASRVWHRYLFAGSAQPIAQYRAWLAPRLRPGQHVHGLGDERPGVAEALDKAQQYMGLAGLVALLLAAVAIAGSGRHYSERHYDTSALLRCMGCRQRDIVVIYLLQLLLLALAGGLIGNGLGWLAQAGLLAVIATLLPENIPPPQWSTFHSGLMLAFVVLIGFTLPSVLRLKSVSPQRVLRNDLAPLPVSAQLVYGGAVTLVAGMMWYYTGNLVLTLGMIGGTAAVLGIAALLLAALFRLLNKLLPRLPVNMLFISRAGIRNLVRRRREAAVQTTAFGLTIMAMLVVVFIRTELIGDWQGAIPDDAANHFVLNIQKNESAAYARYLDDHRISGGALYPVVRGRLTRLNGRPMVARVSKEEAHDESLRRDLNLTWSATLPPDNEIVAGRWWPGDADEPLASVESELAQRLNINLGDRLTLFTGEQEWQARVSSIRRVQWDNFKPNFYLIFSPGALDHLPATWINSFHLAEKDKGKLVDLVKRFPSITLLEVDAILNQVKGIINQVTLAVEAILGFVLAAGVAVTLAAIKASMNERTREGALLRTLGAERGLLRRNQWSEFAGMGLLSGMFGVFGAEIINALLYRRVFELAEKVAWTPAWWAWLVIPVLSAALIGLAGVAASRGVLQHSPLAVLRR